MIETVVVQPGAVPATTDLSGTGVSWPAIFAGAVVSFALTLVLITLGTALGLSSISPWNSSGVSATTFKIATGLYLIVIAMLSSAVGGYIAGRLRKGWSGVHTDEVYFRDTAHGFISWAFATAMGALILGSSASGVVNSATKGAAGGAASSTQSGPMDGYTDALLRPATPTAQANGGEMRSEVGRLLSSSIRSGSEMKAGDRDYLTKVVAARAGITQPEADKRVTEIMTQAKSDIDAARKATASLAFWLTASLLIGALSASLAATEGGGTRDGTWGRKIR